MCQFYLSTHTCRAFWHQRFAVLVRAGCGCAGVRPPPPWRRATAATASHPLCAPCSWVTRTPPPRPAAASWLAVSRRRAVQKQPREVAGEEVRYRPDWTCSTQPHGPARCWRAATPPSWCAAPLELEHATAVADVRRGAWCARIVCSIAARRAPCLAVRRVYKEYQFRCCLVRRYKMKSNTSATCYTASCLIHFRNRSQHLDCSVLATPPLCAALSGSVLSRVFFFVLLLLTHADGHGDEPRIEFPFAFSSCPTVGRRRRPAAAVRVVGMALSNAKYRHPFTPWIDDG